MALLAGCSHSHARAHAQRHAPPRTPTAPQPSGRLSASEYRSIEGEYARLHPLQNARDLSRAVRQARPACNLLKQPDTRLVELVHADCLYAIAFFSALAGIQNAGGQCRHGDPTQVEQCLAHRYAQLALTLRLVTRSALALNRELAIRRIRGLCAQSIGIRQRDLKALRAAELAAAEAASTIAAGDQEGFTRASAALSKAFSDEDNHDALTGIRSACRPGAARRRKAAPHRRHKRGIVPGSGLTV